MKYILSLLFLICLVIPSFAQFVYIIKADSVKITNCDSAELIIENHTQGIPGFLFNTGNGRTQFRRALVALNDSTYLIGTDTLKMVPQYWAANGAHIYNLNAGNVGIRRSQPVTTLDLPGAINIDDTSSYQINYHPMIRVGDLESGAYQGLYAGDSSGKNTAGVQNTYIGGYAGYHAAGDLNTSLGAYAGYGSQPPADSNELGSGFNTFVGGGAGAQTTGTENTYIGLGAGELYFGSFNTITGSTGGGNPVTGDNNSIYGAAAGGYGAGSPNCFFGFMSGNTSTGSNNVYMGTTAGAFVTSGNKNVFIGDSTGNGWYQGQILGDFNTIIGANANMGINNYCTILGSGANAVGNASNATAIGSGSTVGTSNTMVFGNGAVQSWLFGVTAPNSGQALTVGTNSSNGNGAYLTSGGVWTNASDRNKKEHFQTLNDEELLQKISTLPITRWNYKGLPEQHIGPVAQDFYRIFRVGTDDKTISTIDPSGIALAGIQGLYRKNRETAARATEQESEIKEQQLQIKDLKDLVKQQEKEMADQQMQLRQLLEKLTILEAAVRKNNVK